MDIKYKWELLLDRVLENMKLDMFEERMIKELKEKIKHGEARFSLDEITEDKDKKIDELEEEIDSIKQKIEDVVETLREI